MMKAYLKELKVPEQDFFEYSHQITMLFAESMTSKVVYSYSTTIEEQFCNKSGWDEFMPKRELDEKLAFAKSLIGKEFRVNLYYITVKELTGNRYEAFKLLGVKTIKDYHIASYMSKEDAMTRIKCNMCQLALQGNLAGVLPDGSTEELSTDIFVPKPAPKEPFKLPYNQYPHINSRYIIHDATVNDMDKGYYLATKIKKRDISKHQYFQTLEEIKEYRKRIRHAQEVNGTFRKKIFFWEPKEIVEEIVLGKEFIQLAIDSLILSKEYPKDVMDTMIGINKKVLKEKFHFVDDEDEEVREAIEKISNQLSQKYQGKKVIRQIKPRSKKTIYLVLPKEELTPKTFENDRAFIQLIGECLDERHPEDQIYIIDGKKIAYAPINEEKVDYIISMSRAMVGVRSSEYEESGATIINTPMSEYLSSTRFKTEEAMKSLGIPTPMELKKYGQRKWWVKRNDPWVYEREVRFANSAQEAQSVAEEMIGKGFDVILQPHLEGDLVEFYGVGDDFFFADYPQATTRYKLRPENSPIKNIPYDKAKLKDIANKLADKIGLKIYGGECIILPNGIPIIIDLKAFPSIPPHCTGAVEAICDLVE